MKIIDISTIIERGFFNVAFHFFDSRYMVVLSIFKAKVNRGKDT